MGEYPIEVAEGLAQKIVGMGEPKACSDGSMLLRRLRKGDRAAYDEVNHLYKKRPYRTALRILRNEAAAEDAVQDALLVAFSRIHSVDERSSLYTWMTSILTNCCLGELRKRRRKPTLSLEDAFDGDTLWMEQLVSAQAHIDDVLIGNEQVALLNEAVRALQPDHKFTLLARSEQNLSPPDIAKHLGISLAAVKSRALRARKLCIRNVRTLMGASTSVDRREFSWKQANCTKRRGPVFVVDWFDRNGIGNRKKSFGSIKARGMETDQMKPGKVIIAGGSVGGLFAGVLLAKVGWDVTLYERSFSGLSGKGAGLVPQPEVGQILEELGRSDVMKAGVVARERIFLNRDGSIAQKMRRPQAQISWDLLFEALRTMDGGLTYHNGRSITDVQSHADHAAVILDDGSIEVADLVLGADGIGSTVREFVAPGTAPRYAGYAAFRGLAPEASLPVISAGVLFDRFTFYDAPRTQVLGYLVAGADGRITPGKRRYNWVWYRTLTSRQLDEALTSDSGERRTYSAPPGGLSEKTREDLVEAARRSLPSIFSDVIVREPSPFLQAIFDYEAPTLVAGRVALLGDAAFVVRPHTAMGVSKAAGDAISLRDWLSAAPSLSEALRRYNDERLEAGHAIATLGRRLGATLTAE